MIAELIKDPKLKPMKFRELAGFLQVPKEERSELSEILYALIREGKVAVDREGRYVCDRSVTLSGEFFGTGRGFGFVRPEGAGADADIFIPEEKTGGAMHGDTVLVTITCEAYTAGGKKNRAEGIVRRVISRANETIVGTFGKTKGFGFVRPDNTKLDFDVFISREHTKGAETGQKVVCRLRDFGTVNRNPEGMVVEILGRPEEPGVDVMSAIRAFGIPTEFSEEVLSEAAGVPSEVKEEDVAGRLDLRDVLTVTIDGEDAKDLDDAVSVTKHEDGTYSLGVHIADVSHYVREDSALDREAVNRGTSVYFADRVIPMLPVELSNGICSLNAGVDRLALSCLMEINEKGQIIDHRIAETVIHVDKRMSYTDVRKTLSETEETPEDYVAFAGMLRDMEKLSGILRLKREDRGAIDFDFPECKIVIGPGGRVSDIVPYERNVATRLIEDFMLAANETVAEHFFWMELPFVYRNHETPDPEKMTRLNIFINNFGYHIHDSGDTVHAKEIQKLLNRIAGTPEEGVISRLTLRSMKQAKYAPECLGHFGLAARYYCHFTSPIRRYPDLQIHRIIKESLRGELTGRRINHYNEILSDRAERSSRCERRADEAEREVERRKKAEYMHRFLGEEFDGVISGVTAWGLYVELQNTVEGMIRMTDLRDDFYRYDEAGARLIGERSSRVYALGQRIRVQLAAVDEFAATIDFVPAKE
ncbi:MAG: ribonuclease R [Lachnospiraceae bacterium]|nr:ribonuclease R [Lachnospiraceae bacterium]